MKICIIANPNSAHTHRWTIFFVNHGHDVHLIGDHAPLRDPPPNVIFYNLSEKTNTKKYRYIRWGIEARRIIQQLRPDVLHSLSAVSAGWLGWFSGYHPFIVTAMGSDINLLETRSMLFRNLTISTLRNADYVICVSNELSNKVLSYGISPKRCEVVYLGVDINVFHPGEDKHIIRAKLDLDNSPMVLSIRAMNWIYNPLDIANAIPNVLRQHPQAQFAIFTYNQDKELFSQFKHIIDRTGARRAVTYISHINDDNTLADYYRAADVAISVPKSDGTPISVLECLACGTPIVLSDLPSLHDWVKNEKECLFVPTGDVQAINDAIIRLLDNANLRKDMGGQAVNTMEKRADQKLWMQRSEKIYHHLAGNISS